MYLHIYVHAYVHEYKELPLPETTITCLVSPRKKKATAMITTRIFFETILPLLAIFSLSNKNELQNMGVYSFGITNYPKTMNSNCFHF